MAEQAADILNWAVADNEDGATDDSIAPNDEEAEAGLPASHAFSAPPATPDSADERPAMPSAAAAAAAGEDYAPRLRRHRARSRVGILHEEGRFERLAQCQKLRSNDVVTVAVGTYLARGAALRRGGKRRQIARASQADLGAPWLDWIEYTSAHDVLRVGCARVVVTGVGKRPVGLLVVERPRSVAAVAGCPFAAYRCNKLRFNVRDVRVTPVLGREPVSRVLRVLCVEHDWADWVGRHGLEDMPSAFLTSREGVERARFFTNAFVNM